MMIAESTIMPQHPTALMFTVYSKGKPNLYKIKT